MNNKIYLNHDDKLKFINYIINTIKTDEDEFDTHSGILRFCKKYYKIEQYIIDTLTCLPTDIAKMICDYHGDVIKLNYEIDRDIGDEVYMIITHIMFFSKKINFKLDIRMSCDGIGCSYNHNGCIIENIRYVLYEIKNKKAIYIDSISNNWLQIFDIFMSNIYPLEQKNYQMTFNWDIYDIYDDEDYSVINKCIYYNYHSTGIKIANILNMKKMKNMIIVIRILIRNLVKNINYHFNNNQQKFTKRIGRNNDLDDI
jgi:hypothetical protein